jgi:hypothetical protein
MSAIEGEAEVTRTERDFRFGPVSDVSLGAAVSFNAQPRQATSLRKPCLAETLGERGEVLRSAKRC